MPRTERLWLQPYQPDSTAALYEIMSNAGAMRFTYVAPSLQDCEARLSAYESMRSTLGFAPWVVLSQQDSRVIGWGGLSVDPTEPQWGLEVSYVFGQSYWGNGFATELVEYSLAHAFTTFSAKEVNSFVMPENVASIKVLQKCGFQLLRYESRLKRNHYRMSAPSEAQLTEQHCG